MHIPEPARKRLIQLTELLSSQDDDVLTSIKIRQLTGWTDTTVRKDLSYVLKTNKSGEQSAQKAQMRGASNGYNRLELIKAVQNALGISAHTKKCCIIGLGLFARSLAESGIFDASPFDVAAGFDSRLNRVETLNANFPLYHISHLEQITAAESIQYAVVTPDEKDTQNIVKRLVLCGLKGIVNYGSAVLSPTGNTKIENLSPLDSLRNLAY